MGLFAGEWSWKWVGGVSVWALACAGLEFCGIICGCVVAEMGWLGWRLGVFCVRLDFVGAVSGRVIRKLGGKEREMSLSR